MSDGCVQMKLTSQRLCESSSRLGQAARDYVDALVEAGDTEKLSLLKSNIETADAIDWSEG